jgi:3-demethoxyubiquinol 3-hydroxylase
MLPFNPDRVIVHFDRMLRTLFANPISARPIPGADLPTPLLTEPERAHSAALMRVNHSGEVCAQALYQGQALTARHSGIRQIMEQAAREESEHLAWTATRLDELGGRTSILNPIFYAGALALGALAGALGNRWNLGFLEETERQVEGHLEEHLEKMPTTDVKSRAVIRQMKDDEGRHASVARAHGATELPGPVRYGMRAASRLMTRSTYWI